MNSEVLNDLNDRFKGDSAQSVKPSPRRKYMRCKEATEIYGLGRTKLTQLAREAGAVIKIDCTLLIDIEAFDKYLESFRIRGGSFYS